MSIRKLLGGKPRAHDATGSVLRPSKLFLKDKLMIDILLAHDASWELGIRGVQWYTRVESLHVWG